MPFGVGDLLVVSSDDLRSLLVTLSSLDNEQVSAICMSWTPDVPLVLGVLVSACNSLLVLT